MNKPVWINLPNALTMLRILLAPVLIAFYMTEDAERRSLPLILFLAAGLTDCMDGFFARRFNQVTSVGKILDPIADKLLVASVLFCLAWSGVISWLLLIVVGVKEIYMAVGASLCLNKKLEVASDIYGKAATVLFYPAVLMSWPWHASPVVHNLGVVLMYISVAASLLAAAHYTVDSVKKLRASEAH